MTRTRTIVPVWMTFLFAALVLTGGAVWLGGPSRAADAVPGMTVYDIASGRNNLGPIIAGPDGNLWFVEYSQPYVTAKIGRITPSGDVTDYALLALDRDARLAPLSPRAGLIAAGPDGNVWFTDSAANRVGQITPSGAIQEFMVPTPNSRPTQIAAGPDGNVWFTESHGIARVTPDGTITEFDLMGAGGLLFTGSDGTLYMTGALPPPANLPATIHIAPVPDTYQTIVGPDSNFWSVYWHSCRPNAAICYSIYRTTPAGGNTEFHPGIPPDGIATGPDGNLWFIEFGPQVGRITTAGVVTIYIPPTGLGDTRAITAGPDGKLWIVTQNNKIIRLDPMIVMPAPTLTPAPMPTGTPAGTPAAAAALSCTDMVPNAPVALAPFRDTDAAGEALAPNFWGPAFTYFAQDPYDGHTRLVQYFDKGRMELTGTTVTSGLLATEVITGQIQRGDATFDAKPAPMIPIAGDPNGGGLTYATLGTKGMTLLANTPTSRLGLPITTTVSADGTIDPGTPGPFTTGPTVIGNYDFQTQHNVASAFVDYRTKVGLQNIGYAKSEPFLTMVKVGGVAKQVMVQVFERRVLTYTADNPDPYKVEMGNIGQHYFRWRYCGG